MTGEKDYLIHSKEDYIAEQHECWAYCIGEDIIRVRKDIETEKILKALNENRRSLGWVPQSGRWLR